MTFSFNPLTEQELDALTLVEEGIYNFEVIKAEEKVSKAGNPMIELQLKIWDKVGKVHVIFDWLLNTGLQLKKTKHFAESVGMKDKYQSGSFSANDCMTFKLGKAHIVIQPGNANPKGGMYSDKNAVRDYVTNVSHAPSLADEKVSANEMAVPFDDAIPF